MVFLRSHLVLSVNSMTEVQCGPRSMRALRRTLPQTFFCLFVVTACSNSRAPVGNQPPNFVIVFTDDQGYQDVGVFGSPDIDTPNLDRMAAEGIRFTDFYVGQAVCSAS